MKIHYLNAQQAQEKISRGALLVDVRSPAEYAIEHIEGALSLPLDTLNAAQLPKQESLIFTCLSGMRTKNHAEALAALAAEGQEAFILEGGLNAWKQAQLPTVKKSGFALDIMRQVQIAAGSLILLGLVLSATLAPGFIYLSAAVGAGLLFAGLSGWCGMARLLARMPWNRVKQ